MPELLSAEAAVLSLVPRSNVPACTCQPEAAEHRSCPRLASSGPQQDHGDLLHPTPQSTQKEVGGLRVTLSYFTVQAGPLRPRGPPGVLYPSLEKPQRSWRRGKNARSQKGICFTKWLFCCQKLAPNCSLEAKGISSPTTPTSLSPASPHNPFPALAAARGPKGPSLFSAPSHLPLPLFFSPAKKKKELGGRNFQ